MEKLGLFDHFFFKAEQYGVASIVMSGLMVLAPSRSGRPLDPRRITDHLRARLQAVPMLRMKFVQDPLRIGSVHRVEDPEFDVCEHIVVETLPQPVTREALLHWTEQAIARPLDESRLWRWSVIGGLEGGRVAILCRVHHALADGVGASEAMKLIYDGKPVRAERPARFDNPARSLPPAGSLLRGALAESARRLFVTTPGFVIRRVPAIVGEMRRRGSESADEANGTAMQAQPISLNIPGACSRTRRLVYRTMSRSELRSLANRFECTVNDIALFLFSHALQHYLASRGEQVDFDLQCGVPLNTRNQGSAGAGNQVDIGAVKLYNTVPDTARRLSLIHEDALRLKRDKRQEKPLVEIDEIGALVPPLLMDGLMLLETRFQALSKIAGSKPMFNAILSNVPGPAEPLYIADGMLEENIPIIPLVSALALSTGIGTGPETITIGFHCDGEVIEDPDSLVQGVEAGLALLRELHRAPRTHSASGARTSRGRAANKTVAARPQRARARRTVARRRR